MRSVIDLDDNPDKEVTLGMTSLLGIFFGLVLICGIFFGFGYSMGRRGSNSSAATPAATPASTPAASPAPENNVAQAEPPRLAKPSAEQALVSDADGSGSADSTGESASKLPDRAADETADAPPDATSPAPRIVLRNAPATHPALTPAPAYVRPAPAATKATLTTTHQPGAPTPAPASVLPAAAGSIMVQIAAVAHKEDADVLATALHKRGYVVVVRNEAKDSLLHVQVGPFSTRSDAAAMKQRLLGDGYNAILKP